METQLINHYTSQKTKKLRIPLSQEMPKQNFDHLRGNNDLKNNNTRLYKDNSAELTFKASINRRSIHNLTESLGVVDEKLGKFIKDCIEEITRKTKDKFFDYNPAKQELKIKHRSPFAFFRESALYPITQLPLDLLDFGGNLLKKIGFSSLHDSKLLQNHREKIELVRKVDSISGFFETLEKQLPKGKSIKDLTPNELIKFKDSLINSTQNMFSANTGKYDAAKERALNRVVSGFIPAFFLANDAYNLSRLINDKKEDANVEHRTRFNQEIIRVLATAYFQLVLMGGFSKFVNKNKWVSAGLSLGIVMTTETFSRLLNKKPVTFISKEKAKKLHVDEVQKDKELEHKTVTNSTELTTAKIGFHQNIPTRLKSWDLIENGLKQKNNTAKKVGVEVPEIEADLHNKETSKKTKKSEQTETSKKSEKNGLFTMNTLYKWILASAGTGLVVTYARKFKPIDGTYQKFTDFFKQQHAKLTKEDHFITTEKLDELIKHLKDAGFEEQAKLYDQQFKDRKTGEKLNLGKTDKKIKPLINLAIGPFKFLWATAAFPFKLFKLSFNVIEPRTKIFFASAKKAEPKTYLKKDDYKKTVSILSQKAESMSPKDFADYLKSNLLYSFNQISKSGVSNADLAKLVKIVSSAATSWFLIADNYNMVMTKSAGENKEDAVQKAKERAVQRVSGLFYQMLLIDLFNSTFRKSYNASLAGMSAVTASCTVCQEIITRKAIGMPILPHSKDEIKKIEEDNHNKKGIVGKYYRFMSELTGKKNLSAKINKTEK